MNSPQFIDLETYRRDLNYLLDPKANPNHKLTIDPTDAPKHEKLAHIIRNIYTALETAAGNKVLIDQALTGTKVMGYVKTSDDTTINLNPEQLKGHQFDVRHVITHEREHNSNGIHQIAFDPTRFSKDHLEVLVNATDKIVEAVIRDKNGIRLMEGFNEDSTIEQSGYMAGIYTNEVAAAKSLQRLVFKYTGESLRTLFEAGRKNDIELILKKTADILLMQEALDSAVEDEEIGFNSPQYFEIRRQIEAGEFDGRFIQDFRDACFVIAEAKREIECQAQYQQVRTKLLN